jgi:hypothetical protein
MIRMKQTLGILTAAAMLSPQDLSSGMLEGTSYSSLAKSREPKKTQLTKKQQKVRAKNKAAKQSRKKNRK